METITLKSLKLFLSLALSAILLVSPAAAQETSVPAVPEKVGTEKADPEVKGDSQNKKAANAPRPLKNTVAVILAGAAAGSAMGAGLSKDKTKGAILGAIAGGIAAVVYDRVTKDNPPGKI